MKYLNSNYESENTNETQSDLMEKLSSSDDEEFPISEVSLKRNFLKHKSISEFKNSSSYSLFFEPPLNTKKQEKKSMLNDQMFNFKNSRVETPAFNDQNGL
jgi:hypothetical protein